MIVHYKELRWRWWVRPLCEIAYWSHSEALADWAVRVIAARGRYLVSGP